MAISTNSAISAIAAGNDANGGAFDPTAAGLATNGSATAANTASPVFSSATYTFVPGDVGACVFVKAGTNSIPGWYQIQSVAGGAATLNAAAGSVVLYTQAADKPGINTSAGMATVASPTTLTWGVDYSLQVNPQITFTDIVIGAGTSTFTSAAFPVGPNFVGNALNVTGGTGFTAQRVIVISVSGTVATCNNSLGTASSTGGTGRLGGAVATVGVATSFSIGGNILWFKGAFTQAGGAIAQVNSTVWVGYGSLRTDGVQVTVDASGMTAANNFVNMGAPGVIKNFSVTGAPSICFNGGSTSNCWNCKSANSGSDAFKSGVQSYCWASAPTGNGFNGAYANSFCLASGCLGASGNGFNGNGNGLAFNCVAYACAQIGFTAGGTTTACVNCVAYACGGAGFRQALTAAPTFINCVAWGNTGVGFSWASGTPAGHGVVVNCWAGSNSAPTTGGNGYMDNAIGILTADPFTNAAGLDFSLNSTAGGGVLLKAAGFGSILGTAVAGVPDVGAIQGTSAGSGGGGPGGGGSSINWC